jgi:hypothetical protein
VALQEICKVVVVLVATDCLDEVESEYHDILKPKHTISTSARDMSQALVCQQTMLVVLVRNS